MATSRPYPRRTLEQALRVPHALKDFNGGEPWAPEHVAKALGLGAQGGNFFYVSAASRDYGLTEGSRDTGVIALTALGRRATYPQSDAEEEQAKRDAFLSVEPFRRVLEHFKGNNLPERKFLENTLQETFGIDKKFHDEFVDIFQKNCDYLGIGSSFQTTPGVHTATAEGGGSASTGDSAAVTVATPEAGSEAPVCFVIMPFTEREDRHESGFFEEVFKQVLTPAVKGAGFQVRTAKRLGSDVIQATIINDLISADLVVADLTEHNPNVLFELGVRVHEDKPVALVRAQGTSPIFDVDNMLRVEDYNPNLWTSTVERDIPRLRDHIKATWDNRESADTLMAILLRHAGA